MEDFIDSAALLSDIYVPMGMRIVLSGTDSLGFWFARDNELYDRERTFHTTFIPYREYSRILGIDSIDEYIRYGGTLKSGETDFDDEELMEEGVAFRDDESTRRYIDTAICKNIQHSLSRFAFGKYFGQLQGLYEAGELTGAINRIIEDMNHRFVLETLTRPFISHDLGITARNLKRERDPEERILFTQPGICWMKGSLGLFPHGSGGWQAGLYCTLAKAWIPRMASPTAMRSSS